MRIAVQSMLFDLDGTLIDSRRDLARSINLMLEELGRPSLSEDTIAGFVGDGVTVLVRRALTATHPELRLPEDDLHATGIALMHKHYEKQMLVTTSLFPDVTDTLSFFREKRLAVVTSKEVRFTRIILEKLGISHFFNCIVGGDTISARKPDPGPVLEAMRVLGVLPDETVMVGDSENDVNAGRTARTYTCAVTYGFRTGDELSVTNPDVIADRFDQLKDHFS